MYPYNTHKKDRAIKTAPPYIKNIQLAPPHGLGPRIPRLTKTGLPIELQGSVINFKRVK